MPASTNRVKAASKGRERIQEFTLLNRGVGPVQDLLLLTVTTRPDHDQIIYMMQVFQSNPPTFSNGEPLKYRLTFNNSKQRCIKAGEVSAGVMATLSYVGVVHSWIVSKEEVAERGECLLLPKEFFLNSLYGGELLVEVVYEK